MDWTKQQLEAISHAGGDILVTAGAGAGKTGVLTERVVRKIVEAGWSVTDLLVVTFTDAAAAEMRRRIGRKLADALDAARAGGDGRAMRRLENQVVLLEAGQICTLHSFCAQLLREHFHHLGLDPAFEILDPDEAALVHQEVLDELLEGCYNDPGERRERFEQLLRWCRAAGGDRWLRDTILRLDAKINSLRAPEDWWANVQRSLAIERAGSLAKSAWGPAIRRMFELEFEAASAQLEQARAMATAKAAGGLAAYAAPVGLLVEHLTNLRRVLAGSDFWRELDSRFAHYPIGKLVSVKNDVPGKAACKGLIDEVKERLSELRTLTQRVERDLLADLAGLAPQATMLADLCREYHDAYAAAKRERGQLDFNDLERLALRLLEGFGEVRAAVSGQFREVLVDEYQDISPVQNAILRAAAGRDPSDSAVAAPGARIVPLFMVGDLKQSIYRFRLAEPDIFAETLAAFDAKGGAGKLVHLADNFRSRQVVIDSVNEVFAQLMQPMQTLIETGTGPAYDDRAKLKFAAVPYGKADAPKDGPAELHLLEWNPAGGAGSEAGGDEESTPAEWAANQIDRQRMQARLVGRRIGELLGHGGATPATVWDDAAKAWRAARPRDVVILLRTAARVAQRFAEELTAIGLPVHATQPGGYFEAVEVADIRALLAVIDNPRQDIPLAAVLRSPLMSLADSDPLSVDELAGIRLAAPDEQFWDAVRQAAADADALAARLQRFLARISAWRTMARRRPLSELLADIFRVTGYLDYVAGLSGGPQRRANLLHLAHRARQFDRFARQGLSRFARFLDELESAGEDLGIPSALSEADDVVRIMTIHAAKGLEFPIVVMADLEHEFNWADCGDDVLFHRQLLMGLRCVDHGRRIRYASLPHTLIGEQLRLEMLLEEMRLQYVAMTRARDRLIMVGSRAKLDRCLAGEWTRPPERASIIRARRPLDWLASAILASGDKPLICRFAGQSEVIGHLHADGWPVRADVYSDAWLRREFGDESSRQKRSRPDWHATVERGESIAGVRTAPDQPGVDVASVHAAVVEQLSFRYRHAAVTAEPAKRSVSELKHLFETRGEEDEAAPASQGTEHGAGRHPEPMVRGLAGEGDRTPPWELPVTADGRARGLATHAVLQRVDLSAALDDPKCVAAESERMRAGRLLEPHQPDLVDIDAIAAFFASDLGRQLRKHPTKVRREWPFSLAVPIAELVPSATSGDAVLVQGIIDVLADADDDSLIVLDFKTDRVRGEQAARARAETYREQLKWYARAAETILGRKVSARVVYFLNARQAVEL
ncbi:MAG: helicase-exonuclease AddAB subunit AddA [Phycisphaerae bacterium]|nr:helicase-exonuclease AddAB subunit AddA [Phycisphaerae bacterium]